MNRYIDGMWLLNFFVDIPDNYTLTIGSLRAIVNDAPSIDIDRLQGEWISKHNGYWTCSECGLSFLFYAKGNYCPNCGAKMKGADDADE